MCPSSEDYVYRARSLSYVPAFSQSDRMDQGREAGAKRLQDIYRKSTAELTLDHARQSPSAVSDRGLAETVSPVRPAGSDYHRKTFGCMRLQSCNRSRAHVG